MLAPSIPPQFLYICESVVACRQDRTLGGTTARVRGSTYLSKRFSVIGTLNINVHLLIAIVE